ncbi:O-antigen ligase-related [Candidatus Planktophila dulcis]|uniref:O-antigen ligase family protein n=1 Tax=Candidatus Planktophila dulcis TaxID=1884914 RepID=UPI003BEEE530
MLNLGQEKQLTKLLAIGLFVISVSVSTAGLTDPVNVPKLLLLAVFSCASLGLVLSTRLRFLGNGLVLFVGFFLLFALISVVRSSSPLTQNLYGAYGRNNGLIAYFFLSMLIVVTSQLARQESHKKILKALLYVGYVNLAYCLWVILFGDFIPWNNPYGNILGTFGNPNFIGAFLGIFFGVQLSFGLSKDSSRNFKISLLFLLPLTLFEIVDSQAIQGRVLAALSVAIIFFFYLKSRFSRAILIAYSVIAASLGGLALAGAFQRGPLTEIIYKTSVSLRGQYWLAAWNTGESNPISGVGMDAFGDWYRRARDVRAIELPGVNTVVNTAHNVPLDMFAFGGWPLFICYLTLMAISLRSAIRIARNMKGYDAVGVGLITAWVCYQTQSIISINQIGLAIWGWALSGCLIGYDRYLAHAENKEEKSTSSAMKKLVKTQSIDAKETLYVGAFGLLGLLVALPPLSADISLRTAQVSRDAAKLEATMYSSYFNPLNSQKFALNIQAFEGSGLFELSHKYALKGVEWNPEAYELWRTLYLIKNSTQEERDLAVLNMKRLDPLNPDVTSTQ